MAKSSITEMMDRMLLELAEESKLQKKYVKAVDNHTNAVRALAALCEDQETKEEYLTRLEEAVGKKGFVDAIRTVIHDGKPRTPIQIKNTITALKLMDLSVYSNAMASIHTTLRRMKKSGEVRETETAKKEKAYELIKKV